MEKPKIASLLYFPIDVVRRAFSPVVDLSHVDLTVAPKGASEDDICHAVAEATVILTGSSAPRMTRRILQAAKHVKLIQSAGTGYDNMDLQAAQECRMRVANNPGWTTS